MEKTKIFLGPMSKNIVDIVIKYSNEFQLPFVFIPSRRQIEFDGGYVNNWTTMDFCNYVRENSNYIHIERDHGGPGQGSLDDNGLESFDTDCKYFDIIHIDPWKKYSKYEDGLNKTIECLNYCYNKNPNLFFEISTEEGIRKFEVDELEKFILDLKKNLETRVYERIKYFVVQCGTGLLESKNIGCFDKNRLKSMINLCNKYGFISKEHNGDWVSIDIMREKINLGLDCINVAPELGQIETKAILKSIKNIENEDERNKLFEEFYRICFESKKWVKWVSKNFIPEENKEKLINICGHYVFSYPEFSNIENKLNNVKKQIQRDLLIKLREYHSLYNSYYKVVIPTSGTGNRLGELTNYTNKSLIKIGDKFVLSHIIEKYSKYVEFVILLGHKGKLVKDFLELTYSDYYFNFVNVDVYEGEKSSQLYSLSNAKDLLKCPFMFNCCDSLTHDEIKIPDCNTLFVSDESITSESYTSIIGKNNKIQQINLKGEIIYDYLYTGISFIKDYDTFWRICQNLLKKPKFTLGDINVLIEMIEDNKKINYILLKKWFDSGNLNNLKNINKYYNSNYIVLEKVNESICFLNDSVIKFFSDTKMNKDRLLRGKHLYPLTPRIIDYKDNFIKMDLIKGKVLSEIKTKGEIKKLLEWSVKNLWISSGKKSNNFKQICKKFYYNKTVERINTYLKCNKEYNIVNGSEIGDVKSLLNKINFDEIYTEDYSNFHGDFVLDNIIKTGKDYKLIDWRQNFGGDLYNGDKYYDIAKLRHNLIFNHNNIANNLFFIDFLNETVNFELKCNYTLINQIKDLEYFAVENKWNLKKIKILTCLIWINMAPLHNYPLNDFLFYFGKYNLYLEINN